MGDSNNKPQALFSFASFRGSFFAGISAGTLQTSMLLPPMPQQLRRKKRPP
jgi:hypothetical protein